LCGAAVGMNSKQKNFTANVTGSETLWLWAESRQGISSAFSFRWSPNLESDISSPILIEIAFDWFPIPSQTRPILSLRYQNRSCECQSHEGIWIDK
jgi:hypothetical protein